MGLKLLCLIKFSPFALIHTGNDDILSAVHVYERDSVNCFDFEDLFIVDYIYLNTNIN